LIGQARQVGRRDGRRRDVDRVVACRDAARQREDRIGARGPLGVQQVEFFGLDHQHRSALGMVGVAERLLIYAADERRREPRACDAAGVLHVNVRRDFEDPPAVGRQRLRERGGALG